VLPRAAAIAGLLLAASGVAALAQSHPSDVRGSWAEPRIVDLIARGIVAPSGDGLFRPDDPISRAQFVAWLVAARGVPPLRNGSSSFTDVPATHAFALAIDTAAAYGIVPGGGAFRPGAPLVRGDALVILMRALGYTFESAYMVNAPLPYRDADGLPPLLRGSVAIAALSAPPLLREPPADRVRPFEAMTRAEAANLIWSYLTAVESGISLGFSVSLGSGATLVLEKRGALRTLPLWRVQVGSFPDEARARRLADMLRARGLAATVEPVDDLFKVRLGAFATRDEAAALQARLASEGLPALTIGTLRDFESLNGPFWTGVVVIEPAGGVRLRPALAREVMGLGRTSETAVRSSAIAAINGGFFAAGGDPLGCLMVDGDVLSEPSPGRTCVGFTDDGQLLFDTMRFDAAATTEAAQVGIDGVNRERGANELIVYRPSYGPSTRTNAFGTEVIVAAEAVQGVADGRGNSVIPPDGYVLSGHGRSRQALVTAFKPGDRVALRARLVPASGDPRWESVRQVMGGGPRLLASGQYVGGEGFRPSFSDRRHPRTAIGRLADGRIVLVVVGGRQPYHSLGMTLIELAVLMRQLGAVDAMNLDGGGSTTLVVRGAVVNLPSDESGERPVSDVLLVLPPATTPP
jgi:hypothetical protein